MLRTLVYLTIVGGTATVTGSVALNFPADRWCDPAVSIPPHEYHNNIVNHVCNYVTNMALDFAIFLVPIWQLYPLRMGSRKKMGIMLTFGLGFL